MVSNTNPDTKNAIKAGMNFSKFFRFCFGIFWGFFFWEIKKNIKQIKKKVFWKSQIVHPWIKEMLKERYTEDIDVNYEVKAFVKGSKDDKEKEKKLTHMDTGDDLYRYVVW